MPAGPTRRPGLRSSQPRHFHRADQLGENLIDLLAFDFRLMYEFIQKSGLKATPADFDRQTRLLGHPPRKFEDFVKEAKVAFGE